MVSMDNFVLFFFFFFLIFSSSVISYLAIDFNFKLNTRWKQPNRIKASRLLLEFYFNFFFCFVFFIRCVVFGCCHTCKWTQVLHIPRTQPTTVVAVSRTTLKWKQIRATRIKKIRKKNCIMWPKKMKNRGNIEKNKKKRNRTTKCKKDI